MPTEDVILETEPYYTRRSLYFGFTIQTPLQPIQVTSQINLQTLKTFNFPHQISLWIKNINIIL
jgi:hypothetical protein